MKNEQYKSIDIPSSENNTNRYKGEEKMNTKLQKIIKEEYQNILLEYVFPKELIKKID